MSRSNDTAVADDEFRGVMFLRIILHRSIYFKGVARSASQYLQAERFIYLTIYR